MTGGVIVPVEYAMVLTTGFDSVREALEATRCRPCARERGLLAKARPLSNVLGEFRLNGLNWPRLPETAEYVERQAVVQKLDDWEVSEDDLADILDRLFEDFEDPAAELAARVVGLPSGASDLDKLASVIDIGKLLASDGEELVLELKQPESLAPRVPDTTSLEPIEQLHTNGAHVVGGMPDAPAVEEEPEFVPLELDC